MFDKKRLLHLFLLVTCALALGLTACKTQKPQTQSEFFTPPPEPEKWLWEQGLIEIMGLNAQHTISQQAENLKMKGAMLNGDYLTVKFDNDNPQPVDNWQYYPYVPNWQESFVAADGFAISFTKTGDFSKEMILTAFGKKMIIFTPASSTTAKDKKEATLTFKKAD